MGKVYACVGRYAVSPYTIKKACINIYCIEELCYYIKTNAFFVDDDFFEPELYRWIDEECELTALSKELKQKARTERKIEMVVRHLFVSVGYCTEEETMETERLLAANRGMPGRQKLKLRADFLLKNDKFAMAMSTYEDLLPSLDENRDRALIASVYHNLGVIYAKMFLFSEAAEYFEKAYELDGQQEHMVAKLSAYRMMYSEDRYLKKISEMGDVYTATSVLENRLEAINKEYENSDEYKMVQSLKELRSSGSAIEFDNQKHHRLEYFKESYRSQLDH